MAPSDQWKQVVVQTQPLERSCGGTPKSMACYSKIHRSMDDRGTPPLKRHLHRLVPINISRPGCAATISPINGGIQVAQWLSQQLALGWWLSKEPATAPGIFLMSALAWVTGPGTQQSVGDGALSCRVHMEAVGCFKWLPSSSTANTYVCILQYTSHPLK